MRIPWILVCSALAVIMTAGAQELSRTVAAMKTPADLNLPADKAKAVRGPEGSKALRFGESKPASFKGRIDLKAANLDPHDYDLIKLTVKADRGAFMRVGLENYPGPGDISYWYVLDSMRGAFDWRTIYVDLKQPEEIKRGGDKKQKWRRGMAKGTASARGIQISGNIKDLKSKAQGDQRRIWLGPVRLVKEAVHLDWDQTQAPYTWDKGKDLVYSYPLTVTNRLQRPLTAVLSTQAMKAGAATITISPNRVKLAPESTQTVTAKVSLPATVAAQKAPLYCERFFVFAAAEGIQDSTVTILRSSDPIHLTVTVPVPEKAMQFPLLPRPSRLPKSLLKFDMAKAKSLATAKSPKAMIKIAMAHGLYEYGKDRHGVSLYRKALTASAWLYDFTGDDKYKKIAVPLLQALPRIWTRWYGEHQQKPVREISSGIVARWGDRNHYVLGLGWLVMGTQRAPYYYGIKGNGSGGSMSSLAYAFDIMADKLSAADRKAIIDGFFVPAGIQCRNHYIGDGNQQATANVTALYAGLAARNWPLVAYATSSEHGLDDIFTWCFDDDGVQIRKNYQTYTIRPLLWTLELLEPRGLNVYAKYEKRLEQVVNANPRKKGMGGAFQDRYFWNFVKEQRLSQQ